MVYQELIVKAFLLEKKRLTVPFGVHRLCVSPVCTHVFVVILDQVYLTGSKAAIV